MYNVTLTKDEVVYIGLALEMVASMYENDAITDKLREKDPTLSEALCKKYRDLREKIKNL